MSETVLVPCAAYWVLRVISWVAAPCSSIAAEMAREHHYLGIGGSDAHIVSHIGRCATRFPAPVNSVAELVEALRAEDFEAVSFKTAESEA